MQDAAYIRFWLLYCRRQPNNFKVTENRYKYDTARFINLWLLPVLLTVLIFVVLYSKFNSLRDLSVSDILFWIFFLLFSVGIFIFLYFNHLPLARQTELIISSKTFEIIQRSQSYSCDLGDIKEVIEYSTGRLPWSSIAKWIIKTNDREFVISSLTISKLNFERHFWNKTKDKTSLLPRI